MNKNHIIKSILAILVVVGILLISGLYYWLIFSQAKDFAFIFTIIMTSIISAILVLFVYNLMLKIKPKDKDIEVRNKKIKEPGLEDDEISCIDLYSLDNTESSKAVDTKTKNTDSSNSITV